MTLLGCSQEEQQKPEHLLSRDKMIQILADVHTAEATVEHQVVYPDTALMTFNYLQQQILKKHKISEQEFRDTYNYYLDNLKEMDKLYEIIIDTLSVRESKARVQAGQEPVPADTSAGMERSQ
nr:DUF4296 domain-containing protein [Pontibacter ruber]